MILIANICVHFQLLFGGWLITSAEKQNIQIESLKLGRDRGLVIPAVFELSVLNLLLQSRMPAVLERLKTGPQIDGNLCGMNERAASG